MTYDLVRKLKYAKYPQGGHGGWWADGERHFGHRFCAHEIYYEPTLSELIEACAYGFNALAYWPRGNKDGDWEVQSSGAVHHLWATTPEEAVAKLWIALHKKSSEN